MDRVSRLPTSTEREAGALWHLAERMQYIRDNVEPALLEEDFRALPHGRALWGHFEQREAQVHAALGEAVGHLADAIRTGALGPERFRATWEGRGFIQHEEGAGTPADDLLDGLFQMSRLTLGEERPAFGMPNMASRAERIADFLAVTRPGTDDVVLDIGSGSGKVALTVAASCSTRVRGVECGEAYVAAARRSAGSLGLHNLHFLHADARDIELAQGSIFYLYYPFHGEVARTVADALGRLGRLKAITIYAAGPRNGFGEHLLAQVERGALVLSERRGEFGEVLVLRSAPASVRHGEPLLETSQHPPGEGLVVQEEGGHGDRHLRRPWVV